MIREIKNFLNANFPYFYKKLARLKNELIPRFLFFLLNKKKKGVLVYVGVNVGEEFGQLFFKFERCIGFEANPDNYKKLLMRFKKHNNVEIYNYAACEKDGPVEFNISDNGNNAASSSLGIFHKARDIGIDKKIQVSGINLNNFLENLSVDYIDEYISDIEGMDFTVMKTLSPFLNNKKIKFITCEVAKDGQESPFLNIPTNFMSDFEKLLAGKYILVSKGWGYLKEDQYNDVPEDYRFMDCMWKVN